MRLKQGGGVLLFNGRDGEWWSEVVTASKRGGLLICVEKSAPQAALPDLWLMFAPVKKTRTDFIVEKAVEMGVARILPVQTEYTNAERIRRDRLQAHAIEAAEQCGATYVPEVAELAKLDRVLRDWPKERHIMFCDEALAGNGVELLSRNGAWAVLIGPEGGFSDNERNQLAKIEQSHAVALGPRKLRADTAAVAALTIWQRTLGDWQ